MNNKNIKPLTGKEQDQADATSKYFSNYPLSYFGEDTIKNRLCQDYGYNLIKDRSRLTVLTWEIYRQRMRILSNQNPDCQNYPVINQKSTTEAEPEDRVIGGF